MAELGIGTRVFVGWSDSVGGNKENARCKIGTIIDGPINQFSSTHQSFKPFFDVKMDYGDVVSAIENLLTPIDDGEWLDETVFQGQTQETANN